MNSLDIIRRSFDLRSAYALWVEDRHLSYLDETNATYFLLDYTVFSQSRYNNIVIDEHIFAKITEPKYPYLTILELFVTALNGRLIGNDEDNVKHDLHRWYYTVGMPEYKLFPLLCGTEIDALSKIPSAYSQDGAELTLLDEMIHKNNQSAKTKFDLTQRSGLLLYISWKTNIDLTECAPWMPRSPRQNNMAVIEHGSRNQSKEPATTPIDNTRSHNLRLCGVNIIGFAGAILGLGEDLHSFVRIVKRIGVNVALVDIPLSNRYATSRNDHDYFIISAPKPIFSINIFCIPLFETERFRLRIGADCMQGRYNIGNFPWELSTVPEYWCHAFDYMDEIWAISPFLREVYSSVTTKPVLYMPPLVHVGTIENFDVTELGLDDSQFIFLSFCDFNSYSRRKNPMGTVQAFRRAFPSRKSDERLIVKTLNGHVKSDELNTLLLAVADDPRIILVDGPYSRQKAMGLLSTVDCYVSLHRSEGFGRVLGEAMLLSTPIIATAYSGSNAILDEKTGFPVDYHLEPVSSTDYCYTEGSVWAEPSLDSAVDQMRFVAGNSNEVLIRVQHGLTRIAQNHSLETVSKLVGERLQHIVES